MSNQIFTLTGSIRRTVRAMLGQPERADTGRRYFVCEECRLAFYLTAIEVSHYLLSEKPYPCTCRLCASKAVNEKRNVGNLN